MDKKWIFWSALALAAAVVAGLWIAGSAYRSARTAPRTVSVTGNAEQDFESDLIVWTATYRERSATIGQAYEAMEPKRRLVEQFLSEQGLSAGDYTFSSVTVEEAFDSGYDARGNYYRRPNGYTLSRSVTVSSGDLDRVEQISKDISTLLARGVEIASLPPRYYYTKMSDLKHQMLRMASEDALSRAEEIASGGHARIGRLRTASMGVFQIVGKNADEDYSWGGSFNTANRHKTISVTVKAAYELR